MTQPRLNKVLPHGNIEKVFDDVWFIQGQVKMPMLFPPMKASKAMTIIRNAENNELTLINAMPLDDEGLQKLSALGIVKNTLNIGAYHGRDDAFYKHKFGTTAYALKGFVYSRNFDKVPKTNPDDGYFKADIYLDDASELPLPEASLKIIQSSNPIEALLHLGSNGGILVSADALQNMAAPDQFCNFFAKKIMKKLGFFKPYNVGPGWAQFAKPSLKEVRSILDMNFDNVLPGHGDPVIGDAKEKYRPVLESDIKGCAA